MERKEDEKVMNERGEDGGRMRRKERMTKERMKSRNRRMKPKSRREEKVEADEEEKEENE